MSNDIVLWYDYIENGILRNNLKFDDTILTNSNVGLPYLLVKNNVDFIISPTAYGAEYLYKKYSKLKNFYTIEFLFYNSLDKKTDLPIGDHWFFKKDFDEDIEILIWYPGEGFEIRKKDEPINRMFDLVRSKFPNIKIRFVFGNFVKSKNIPDNVNYKCFKNYFWFDTIDKIQKPPTLDRNKSSQYTFITLNRRYRESRYMAFHDLKSSGMLENARYTNLLDNRTLLEENARNVIKNGNSYFLEVSAIEEDLEFVKRIQTVDYYEDLYSHACVSWGVNPVTKINIRLPDIDLNNCSYLEVVNETVFDSTSNLFITEKTFRAIAVGHIFLVCGQPGLLAHLKREGFQTFDDLFDESYDRIQSFSQRWAIIKKNLQMWLNMSKSAKRDYYLKSFDKLVHNQNLLYSRDFKTEIEELFE